MASHPVPTLPEETTFDEFVRIAFIPNRPVRVTLGKATSTWPVFRNWAADMGKLNTKGLIQQYGSWNVPILDCKSDLSQQLSYFSSNNRDEQVYTRSTLVDYISSVLEPSRTIEISESDIWHQPSKHLPYLKDWHFQLESEKHNSALVSESIHDCKFISSCHKYLYQPPKYFLFDWLNAYCLIRKRNGQDDYRFVYLGPAGSWTPLHCDVLGSYSWSLNVAGRKLWRLYPPSETTKILSRVDLSNDVRLIDHTGRCF